MVLPRETHRRQSFKHGEILNNYDDNYNTDDHNMHVRYRKSTTHLIY